MKRRENMFLYAGTALLFLSAPALADNVAYVSQIPSNASAAFVDQLPRNAEPLKPAQQRRENAQPRVERPRSEASSSPANQIVRTVERRKIDQLPHVREGVRIVLSN